MTESIDATLRIKLKPWTAPNFARIEGFSETSTNSAIPVADLDADTLDALALAWIGDLFTKAGRNWSPELVARTIKAGSSRPKRARSNT